MRHGDEFDYFGARYYSNGLGQFIMPDWAAKPITVPYANFGDPQSLNLYGHVRNNHLSNAVANPFYELIARQI